MFELVSLLAIVVAFIAINKANSAIQQNAELSSKLTALQHYVQDLHARYQEALNQYSQMGKAGSGATGDSVDPQVVEPKVMATEVAADAAPAVSLQEAAPASLPEAVARTALVQDAVVTEAALPGERQTPAEQVEIKGGEAAIAHQQAAPQFARPEPFVEPPEATPAEAPAGPREMRAKGDVERAFATKWTVWIGGIALAMGGLLIVRYSIEAGFFGPGVRLMLGAAFSLAVAAASEFCRRRDLRLNLRDSLAEQIPGVLAGVSVLSAFGVAYAAHAVYGMIGPGLAFTTMGAIGLTALAVSLLHGPKFGLFGLLGSYVTPILVSGTAPNYLALSTFVAIVTTAVFLLQLRRPSTLLVAGSIVGHTLWTALIALGRDGSFWGCLLLAVAIILAILHAEQAARNDANSQSKSGAAEVSTALAAFASPLVLAGVLWVEIGGGGLMQLTLFFILAGNVAAAIRHAPLTPLAPLAGAAATGLILLWPDLNGPLRVSPGLIFDLVRLDLVPSSAPGLAVFATLVVALICAPVLASLFGGWRAGGEGAVSRGCLAFAAALTPVCIMLAASLRLNGFNRTLNFAIIAALLALAFAIVSELLYRRERARAWRRGSTGIYRFGGFRRRRRHRGRFGHCLRVA